MVRGRAVRTAAYGNGAGWKAMSEVSAIVERISAEGIRTVDFRFIDLAGRWLHLGREVTEANSEDLTRVSGYVELINSAPVG